jgi:hypothetical protein
VTVIEQIGQGRNVSLITFRGMAEVSLPHCGSF